MVVCSVNGHEVVSLSPIFAELVVTCVDTLRVVLVENVSVPYVDVHGVLVSSNDRYEAVLLLLTSAELILTCVEGDKVASLSVTVEDVSVLYVDGRREMVDMDLCSVNRNGVGLLVSVTTRGMVCVDGQAVVSAVVTPEELSIMSLKENGELLDMLVCSVY